MKIIDAPTPSTPQVQPCVRQGRGGPHGNALYLQVVGAVKHKISESEDKGSCVPSPTPDVITGDIFFLKMTPHPYCLHRLYMLKTELNSAPQSAWERLKAAIRVLFDL